MEQFYEAMTNDITRSTMPATKSKTYRDHAEELLARFPGADSDELLRQITASYLMDFKYGNKREERAACDFLNLLQAEAIKLKPANQKVRRSEPDGTNMKPTGNSELS